MTSNNPEGDGDNKMTDEYNNNIIKPAVQNNPLPTADMPNSTGGCNKEDSGRASEGNMFNTATTATAGKEEGIEPHTPSAAPASVIKIDEEAVLDILHPTIRSWFRQKFSSFTAPQKLAIPLIHEGRSVLVSSSTGSGKTLTAFLSIINELFEMAEAGTLQNTIYCLYISPLKALANDINRNLEVPLREIRTLAKREGRNTPQIRVAVRSGDTSSTQRQKMAKTPPHIFITTPESLNIILSTPKFSKNFSDLRYVIVDEIHELASSKRGILLSVALERLEFELRKPLTRIGLSATQAPITEIAKFLGGFEKGQPRPINIIEVNNKKTAQLSIISPLPEGNLNEASYLEINDSIADRLKDIISRHTSTLVFTNTRAMTERMVMKLKKRGLENVAAHHGSLSKDIRQDVEAELKVGNLRATVSSTSLELGIDIGSLDLVCQISSPKSMAKALQRIGRAGHTITGISKGIFIPQDMDDLVESAAVVRLRR
ncbi:MAG: DEAD/DEAH box helicase [Thermoplasmata archaeon]